MNRRQHDISDLEIKFASKIRINLIPLVEPPHNQPPQPYSLIVGVHAMNVRCDPANRYVTMPINDWRLTIFDLRSKIPFLNRTSLIVNRKSIHHVSKKIVPVSWDATTCAWEPKDLAVTRYHYTPHVEIPRRFAHTTRLGIDNVLFLFDLRRTTLTSKTVLR